MLSGKLREALYGSLHRFEALHSGDCIALALQAFALSPHGTKAVHGGSSGPTTVETVHIRPEDKDLVGLQRVDAVG